MKRIIILLILLSFTTHAEAVKLKLKSGFFFSGEIIGIHEDEIEFKASFGRQIVYKFEDIQSIDDKDVIDFRSLYNSSKNEKTPENLNKENVNSDAINLSFNNSDILNPALSAWDSWRLGIRDYHINIEHIVKGVNHEFEVLRRNSMTATNEKQVLTYIRNFRNYALLNIIELEQLQPPADLTLYHQKIIQHLQLLDKSQAVLEKMDFDEANKLLYRSRQSYFQAMIELRDIFKVHDAPEDIIAGMDKVLQEYDKALN